MRAIGYTRGQAHPAHGWCTVAIEEDELPVIGTESH